METPAVGSHATRGGDVLMSPEPLSMEEDTSEEMYLSLCRGPGTALVVADSGGTQSVPTLTHPPSSALVMTASGVAAPSSASVDFTGVLPGSVAYG